MENNIELGSEFNLSLNDLQVKENNLFHYMERYEVQWYDYGRSAIKSIPIEDEKTILLPEFICESVINCFKNNIVFYKIDDQFNIDINDLKGKINKNVGYIYLAHYFGFFQKQEILDEVKIVAKKHGAVIIEDTTQSLFSVHELIGDYVVASIRKWMPVPMGGMLYINRGGYLPSQEKCKICEDNTRAYGMILKDMFLNMEYDTNSRYRKIFSEVEERIDNQEEIYMLSDFAKFLISCVDIDEIISKRIENAKRLSEGLKRLGVNIKRDFSEGECPLALPIRVKNRDQFRSYLMNNRIYCAVHWPFDGFKPEERVQAICNADTLISLPIDQRYGNREIDYLLKVIEQYGGGLLR